MADEDPLLTVPEAARRLGVTGQTVREYIANGTIREHAVVTLHEGQRTTRRIRQSEVERLTRPPRRDG